MAPSWGAAFLGALIVLFNSMQWIEGVSVMSVDFGSEWMKVAIVSPGVPMEIALNKESKRKTPAFISFRDGERTFGEDAQTVAVRFPKNGYGYLLDLLGKKIDNPIVQMYRERFPWYDIVEDPDRGTVLFNHDSDTQFTPEELIGMLLAKAKEFAEESAGQPIADAVLVVPGFFNQAERQAMLNAARFAGLKVLQLINDHTAVALNYGIFRRKDFNESAQYIMFYDMGASSTSAALVSYQLVKSRDRGVVETNPQAAVLGVGYDRTLGGLDIQIRLQKFLAEKFNAVKKTKNDVFKNPRAMAKLFKEAGRLKNVLSANVDHYAQVEGLLDEEDFKVKVTREDLEDLCKDLVARVGGPVEQALNAAGVSMDIINQVILVGAGTRVPMVQDALAKVVKRELGKNINTDEAAVMGAAYKAADISTGFKVKKFITKDAVVFPVLVSYERETDSGEVKHQKRTLFGYMNAFPQKKMITFNKYTKDFDFTVYYGELDHLPPKEVAALGPLTLAKVSLLGVEEAIAKHSGPNVDPKGIKAHFTMDDSGILSLVTVDYVVEKVGGDEQSTLQKIGSGISKLFGGSKPGDGVETEQSQAEGGGDSEEKLESEQPPKPETVNSTEEKKPEEKTEAAGNGTDVEKDKKLKVSIVKEVIASQVVELGVKGLSEQQLETSLKKIGALDEFDAQKRRKEKARNQLEAFTFDVQNKLDGDLFVKSATQEEKESITKSCSEISTWLEEEGFDADAAIYEEKLSLLKSLTGPLFRRVREHEERPEAVTALKNKLAAATEFAVKLRNKTESDIAADEETIFTVVELDALDKLISETKEWLQKTEKDQKKLDLSANPALTVRSIVDKLAALDRENSYLLNKAKIWRPTKKPVNETKPDTAGKKSNETAKETEEKPEPVVIEPATKEGGAAKEPGTEEATKEAPSDYNLGYAAWMACTTVALIFIIPVCLRWALKRHQ